MVRARPSDSQSAIWLNAALLMALECHALTLSARCSTYVLMAKWTVQTLIDARMQLTAFCHNSRCNHNKVLDLTAIRDKLGPDAPAMADDLIPKLRCDRCGGKSVGLTYAPRLTDVNPYLRNSNGR